MSKKNTYQVRKKFEFIPNPLLSGKGIPGGSFEPKQPPKIVESPAAAPRQKEPNPDDDMDPFGLEEAGLLSNQNAQNTSDDPFETQAAPFADPIGPSMPAESSKD